MSGHRSAQLDFLPFKCHGINLGRGGKGGKKIKVANELFLKPSSSPRRENKPLYSPRLAGQTGFGGRSLKCRLGEEMGEVGKKVFIYNKYLILLGVSS